ncbi:hypothetical protein FRC98_01675 [Lujinxingia vulgaris]|uniref:Uncharacterized protein n=1 Tax=Lujinxingia vulgaris TaxID=2600176 RepID=A0A5C6XHY1_9DELT|nr:hypothetical protein [Lujinxingia vulgaris]TXD39138.1 hypothetical protein FRC98_01675 [Lujinxingia vulgaris]
MATDPLARLERAIEVGGQRPTLRWEEVPESDPIARLQELIRRGDAKRDEPPVESLQELFASARELPEPEPWTSGQGDPLERLRALWREPAAPATDTRSEMPVPEDARNTGPTASSASQPGTSTSAPSSQNTSVSTLVDALGAQVYRSLRERPLPGEVRAELAARIAALLDARQDDPELRDLLDLVIFGR